MSFFFPTDHAGLYAAGCPLEDADSRTIFVSNVRAHLLILLVFGVCAGFSIFSVKYVFVYIQVHFAATKDNLTRLFYKFGDVLKVVLLTDAATGQPKA